TGYTTGSLAPNGEELITLEVTPNDTPDGNSSKDVTVEVYRDGTDPTVDDSVKATTTVNEAIQPDALIKRNSEADPAYAIDGAYQTTPSGDQIESQSIEAGSTATYQIKIANDGNKTRTFSVLVTETGEFGWVITYKDSGDTDITSEITDNTPTTGGYTTGVIARGASEIITVTMTPDGTVVQGTSTSATLEAHEDNTDFATVLDSVQATTSLVADTTAPTVAGCTANNTQVTVTFSEAVRESGADLRGNYTIAGVASDVGTSNYDPNTLTTTITFAEPTLTTGDTPTVTVSTNVKDIVGNAMGTPNSCNPTVADSTPPTIASCSADPSALEVTFDEGMLTGTDAAAATNKTGYTVESPIGTPVNISGGGVTLTYDGAANKVIFTGISLTSGNTFKIAVAGKKDASNNAITENGVDNVCSGTVSLAGQPDLLIKTPDPDTYQ
ncbi:MAG: hypothetical protein GW893_24110, partial [Armatimonadetes bacterium]|nr:hypothetical protein [Armatimonadota bacterium]